MKGIREYTFLGLQLVTENFFGYCLKNFCTFFSCSIFYFGLFMRRERDLNMNIIENPQTLS